MIFKVDIELETHVEVLELFVTLKIINILGTRYKVKVLRRIIQEYIQNQDNWMPFLSLVMLGKQLFSS